MRAAAVRRFFELRARDLGKKPSLVELLVWLTILAAKGFDDRGHLENCTLGALPALPALIKDQDDLERLRLLRCPPRALAPMPAAKLQPPLRALFLLLERGVGAGLRLAMAEPCHVPPNMITLFLKIPIPVCNQYVSVCIPTGERRNEGKAEHAPDPSQRHQIYQC